MAAEFTYSEKKVLRDLNQSCCIPLGEVHRLANPGKVLSQINEFQSGSYLDEDNVIRFKNRYGGAAD